MKQAQFEIKDAHGGQFHFIMRAKNSKVILQSQMYDTKAGAEKGIKSIVDSIKSGKFKIVDKTK